MSFENYLEWKEHLQSRKDFVTCNHFTGILMLIVAKSSLWSPFRIKANIRSACRLYFHFALVNLPFPLETLQNSAWSQVKSKVSTETMNYSLLFMIYTFIIESFRMTHHSTPVLGCRLQSSWRSFFLACKCTHKVTRPASPSSFLDFIVNIVFAFVVVVFGPFFVCKYSLHLLN